MASIRVVVALHGELRARFPDRAQAEAMTLPAGSCVADALALLGHAQDAWLVSVNGCAVNRSHRLDDGDRLDLYPFLEGG